MKRFLTIQAFELLFELILVFIVSLSGAMAFGKGTVLLSEAMLFAITFWSAALLYRSVLLQLPIVVAIKYTISRRHRLPVWAAALINLIGLCTTFAFFEVFFGGAKSFFQGEALIATVSLFVAVAFAPFLVEPMLRRGLHR